MWNYIVSVLGTETVKRLMAEKNYVDATPADEAVSQNKLELLKLMKPFLPKDFGQSRTMREKLKNCVGFESCTMWNQIANGNF